MLKLIPLSLLFIVSLCFAQVPGQEPAGHANEAGMAVIQMLSENHLGMKLLKKQMRFGPIIGDAQVENLRSSPPGKFPVITVSKFTLSANDCLGTDSCAGRYLWTVISTSQSDGYSYHTDYENTVVRLGKKK